MEAVGGQANRTMLLQLGRSDLRLISPDQRQVTSHHSFPNLAPSCQVLLHCGFKELSHCSPGEAEPASFGLVCRDVAPGTLLALLFQCTGPTVVAEVLHGLRAAFTVASPAKSEATSSGLGMVARRAKRSLAESLSGMVGRVGRATMAGATGTGDAEPVTLTKVGRLEGPVVTVEPPSPAKAGRTGELGSPTLREAR